MSLEKTKQILPFPLNICSLKTLRIKTINLILEELTFQMTAVELTDYPAVPSDAQSRRNICDINSFYLSKYGGSCWGRRFPERLNCELQAVLSYSTRDCLTKLYSKTKTRRPSHFSHDSVKNAFDISHLLSHSPSSSIFIIPTSLRGNCSSKKQSNFPEVTWPYHGRAGVRFQVHEVPQTHNHFLCWSKILETPKTKDTWPT